MATPKGHAQWYGLQNCQYSQQRPQVYVTMTTEQDHVSSNQEISGNHSETSTFKSTKYEF